MARQKRETLPATISVWPSERSAPGGRLLHCDFDSESPAMIAAHEADLRWFGEHLGELSRIRLRVMGEFEFMEPQLPPFLLVEARLLPDGRLLRRPIFPRELQ
jgi:hypothetical protein